MIKLAELLGLLGAIASLIAVMKQLYDFAAAMTQLRADIRAADAQIHADLILMQNSLQSQREDFTQRLGVLEERIKKLEEFIDKRLTWRE